MGMRITRNDVEDSFPFPPESFDVVTALEVMEQVGGSARRLLSEIKRVLKPGGVLYIGTPNVYSWAKVRPNEHDPWTLKALVASEGFIVQECTTWTPHRSGLRGWRDALLRLASGCRLATFHFKDAAQLWRLRGRQIGLVARKRLEL
jgi:SAM-dependent methyltransferase